MPPDTTRRLAVRAATAFLLFASGSERLLASGLEPMTSAPDDMPGFMRREQERYAAVIRSANIQLEP